MNRCRATDSSVQFLCLVIAFATVSPNIRSQSAPALELPSADPSAAPSSTRTLYPSPILAYQRPSEKEKLKLFAFDAFGPYAFAVAAGAGAVQQGTNSPPEWGTGAGAFGERMASNFGIQLVTTATRYGLAEILRDDAAYYRCRCRGLFPRLGHALVSTVTERRGEDGHTVFSVSGLVAPYAGTMTALAWYPGRYGVKDGFRMGNYNLLGQAAGNLALEFIYGGPHTLFSRIGRPQPVSATAANQNY